MSISAKIMSANIGNLRRRFLLDEAHLGSLEHPTKKGLITIAKEGKDVWNEWQEEFRQNYFDFSELDFSIDPIDFSGFNFKRNYPHDGWVKFNRPHFGKAIFSGCSFKTNVFFRDCEFVEIADFS